MGRCARVEDDYHRDRPINAENSAVVIEASGEEDKGYLRFAKKLWLVCGRTEHMWKRRLRGG